MEKIKIIIKKKSMRAEQITGLTPTFYKFFKNIILQHKYNKDKTFLKKKIKRRVKEAVHQVLHQGCGEEGGGSE